MNNDGFKLVKSRTRKTSLITKPNSQLAKTFKINDIITTTAATSNNISELYKRILECKSKLSECDQNFYWPKVQMELRKLLSKYFMLRDYADTSRPNTAAPTHNIINIVCYGLGSPDDNLSSRYQLALLLLIIDDINAFDSTLTIGGVELYDPVFTPIDKHVLVEVLKLKLAAINDRCMRRVSLPQVNSHRQPLNLFYMPHCGKALYNNLLYANWSTRGFVIF